MEVTLLRREMENKRKKANDAKYNCTDHVFLLPELITRESNLISEEAFILKINDKLQLVAEQTARRL